ncbi:hypothetical protein [Natronolimnobius baerhuensis]|uniref:Uncharacterized protein n=1 Tax=Natronolimnobius baerhuensis TaxID=253108 RepID=A0A202ED17_9EURY|nr:hypothetical protein [Natronolimnobius baerhuensis]OVE86078.1 hypothetical protein B2G88_04590 [Natronolimnobius baerhuensis]
MSEDLHEEITDVLDRASGERESLLPSGEQSGEETETESAALLEAADDASDLLESADPEDLLEALELDTLPDGSTASSIPEAIAKGESAAVARLQQLLRLAKFADHDAADLDGALETLRDGIGNGTDDYDAGEDETADSDVSESETDDSEADDGEHEESDDSEIDKTEHKETDDSEREETDESDTTSELTEQLRSSMESSLSAFSEDIGSLQEGLEAVQSGLSDTDESDADEADDEEHASDSDEEDDGLLEPDLEADLGGEQGSSAGGDGTRHSTMAPPPSERADMKGTARFSTMPDR